MERARRIVEAALVLRSETSRMTFAPPVTHVYNPLEYAWEVHRAYLERYGRGRKRTIFLGMNPGPWGMAQIGVPFGEVAAARDWLGLEGPVGRPAQEHPKRPVQGFACARSEVSGRRLWGLFAERFGTPEAFFRDHFVGNYCPLAFLEESGKNRTPDKLPARERDQLIAACDRHLAEVVRALEPERVVGIGAYAAQQAERALEGTGVAIGTILHPSPASPAANRGWAPQAVAALERMGAWTLP